MRYAAYGSNLHPLRLAKRVSSTKLIGTAFIPEWSLHFHKRSNDKSGKCNIVTGGDGIHVAVFDISVADKLTLDEIEGISSGYSKFTLSVPGFGDCASYIADESHIADFLAPYDWYKELVLIGACLHGFPGAYLDKISSISSCQDPDSKRRAEKWRDIELFKSQALLHSNDL